MIYQQLVEQVRPYQLAKMRWNGTPVPTSDREWLAMDLQKLSEEVGEVVGECVKYEIDYRKVRDEIADVAICLACVASDLGVEIDEAVEDKLIVLKKRLDDLRSRYAVTNER